MGWDYKPYVSVAARRAQADKAAKKAAKAGHAWSPVTVQGRSIAKTFWDATAGETATQERFLTPSAAAPEQIEGAREKIDLILRYLERNGHMSTNYFEQILGGDDERVIDNFMDRNPNDVLVFGPNGKTVRARTSNQKKLVEACDKNDILFAIGPAGTG